jgi:hypothetical protein
MIEIDVGAAFLAHEPQLPQLVLPPRRVRQMRQATCVALAVTINATMICCQASDIELHQFACMTTAAYFDSTPSAASASAP